MAMTVLEKNAEVHCLAQKIGGVKALKKFDAKLMRFVYKNKYSKKETEVKTAEVK